MRKTLALALALVSLALITPPLKGSKVLAQPVTQTIFLNTGFDQWLASPALIPVGQKDNEWRVITDSVNGVPNPSLATGRPADVVSNATWGVFQDANFPNSRWISVTPAQGAPVPTPPPSGPFNEFQYAFYFTLPAHFFNPVLTMKLSADDHITKVTLNSHTLFQGSGGIFINPPLTNATFTSPPVPADFLSGPDVNVITVDVLPVRTKDPYVEPPHPAYFSYPSSCAISCLLHHFLARASLKLTSEKGVIASLRLLQP